MATRSDPASMVSGHHRTASKMPFGWRFAGGAMVAHFCMFTGEIVLKLDIALCIGNTCLVLLHIYKPNGP